jgi:hypothetical protein
MPKSDWIDVRVGGWLLQLFGSALVGGFMTANAVLLETDELCAERWLWRGHYPWKEPMAGQISHWQ